MEPDSQAVRCPIGCLKADQIAAKLTLQSERAVPSRKVATEFWLDPFIMSIVLIDDYRM